MQLFIQSCCLCGTLVMTAKVGSCLCSVHERMIVKKVSTRKPRQILHRLLIQNKVGIRFVQSVNKILVGRSDYVKLKGEILDE